MNKQHQTLSNPPSTPLLTAEELTSHSSATARSSTHHGMLDAERANDEAHEAHLCTDSWSGLAGSLDSIMTLSFSDSD